MAELPVLWHLKVSPFNEKARWALDFKQVAHRRRAGVPGRHIATAQRLGGGRTFPVLLLGGQAYADSTSIVAALERTFPDRPLYPADPDLRRRALELEDLFTEQLGPAFRVAFFDRMIRNPALTVEAFFGEDVPRTRRWLLRRPAWPLVRRAFRTRVGLTQQTVAQAHDTIRSVGEVARAAQGRDGYLVGDTFTVADLTLAAMTSPAVAPAQFPYAQPQRDHPVVAPLRERLDRAGLLEWSREMYARHRGESAEVAR